MLHFEPTRTPRLGVSKMLNNWFWKGLEILHLIINQSFQERQNEHSRQFAGSLASIPIHFLVQLGENSECYGLRLRLLKNAVDNVDITFTKKPIAWYAWSFRLRVVRYIFSIFRYSKWLVPGTVRKGVDHQRIHVLLRHNTLFILEERSSRLVGDRFTRCFIQGHCVWETGKLRFQNLSTIHGVYYKIAYVSSSCTGHQKVPLNSVNDARLFQDIAQTL